VSQASASAPQRLTSIQWLVCVIAAIGFAFDIYELLMLPLIAKTAIPALAAAPPEEAARWIPGGDMYGQWARALFFLPALAGGVFGLIGGYLTDRLGRRRVLTWSILLYAGSAAAAGYATSLEWLLFFRCLVFIGVCVEFVAAVAWLAELFPNREQRERVLGYTQAFSSLGGVLVAVANHMAASYAGLLPEIHGGHEAWRYTLISGLIPAIPLIVIRPFLPESPEWERKRQAGTLRRPNIMELFAPKLRRTTIVTTIAFASTFGLAFGAIQQTQQILTGHVDLRAAVAETERAAREDAQTPLTPKEIKQKGRNTSDQITSSVTTWQEVGGVSGRLLLAYLAVIIVSRRSLFRVFQIPSLLLIPTLYWWLAQNLDTPGTLAVFKYAIFFAGLVVVGQMSFWGNYIPHVFPVHLRGTGESFAANIGGRVIGTAAAWLTLTFSFSKQPDPAKMAMVAATVAGIYALAGFLFTFLLPEPSHLEDEEDQALAAVSGAKED
jgi:MFS family permease